MAPKTREWYESRGLWDAKSELLGPNVLPLPEMASKGIEEKALRDGSATRDGRWNWAGKRLEDKSCKGFSSKDKSSSSRSDLDKIMNNVSNSSLELDHMISYEGKSNSGRSKFDEKCATPDEAKKNIILKTVAAEGISRERE
ncbi:Uncharacterized protein Fot_40614 [Forsythia ovata]|uniref:Uncharacterized protein n=1 Tax=Forsythia ovata TaxID=205694 RepID=A0ABD1S7X9_9LAMI